MKQDKLDKKVKEGMAEIEASLALLEVTSWLDSVIMEILTTGNPPVDVYQSWKSLSKTQKELAFFNLLGRVHGFMEPPEYDNSLV